LGDYIIEGTTKELAQNENSILLGAGIAKKLSLKVGDVVSFP
jgi:lipoprotein-releasing system permease protein